MIITTTNTIENYQVVEYLGIVKSFREDYWNVKKEMEDLINDLIKEAEGIGADAIIGLTISSASTYGQDDDGCTKPDMIAYGTAVKIKKTIHNI